MRILCHPQVLYVFWIWRASCKRGNVQSARCIWETMLASVILYHDETSIVRKTIHVCLYVNPCNPLFNYLVCLIYKGSFQFFSIQTGFWQGPHPISWAEILLISLEFLFQKVLETHFLEEEGEGVNVLFTESIWNQRFSTEDLIGLIPPQFLAQLLSAGQNML